MHNPHNKEIIHALTWLIGNHHIKNQAEAVRKLGVSRGLLSNIVNDRERASEEFRRNFDAKLLAEHGESLAKFKKPRPLEKVLAEEDATEIEHLISRVEMTELLVTELIKLNCVMQAEIFMIADPKRKRVDPKTIEKRLFDTIRAKVSKARALNSEKQVS